MERKTTLNKKSILQSFTRPIALGLTFIIRQNSFSAVIYVKPTGSNANSSASWAQAFPSLQKAIETAAAGDEIWVAQGS